MLVYRKYSLAVAKQNGFNIRHKRQGLSILHSSACRMIVFNRNAYLRMRIKQAEAIASVVLLFFRIQKLIN
ncbi:hypothetical protein D3C79_929470 [compost metagenome]